jgi:hypothetical protein
VCYIDLLNGLYCSAARGTARETASGFLEVVGYRSCPLARSKCFPSRNRASIIQTWLYVWSNMICACRSHYFDRVLRMTYRASRNRHGSKASVRYLKPATLAGVVAVCTTVANPPLSTSAIQRGAHTTVTVALRQQNRTRD